MERIQALFDQLGTSRTIEVFTGTNPSDTASVTFSGLNFAGIGVAVGETYGLASERHDRATR